MEQELLVNETSPETVESNENQSHDVTSQEKENRSSSGESFRALREKAEKAERERDQYHRTLQEIEMRAAIYQQQSQQQQSHTEPDVDPNDEDLLEGKHYRKLVGKYRQLEEKLEHATRKSYENAAESRIRSKYNDFDDIVTAESIKALRESEPELAASLHANPDVESKAVATYKAIKRMGLQPSTEYNSDKELAQKNSVKPKSLASISPQQGESPMSRANAFANGLTDDLKKTIIKRDGTSTKKLLSLTPFSYTLFPSRWFLLSSLEGFSCITEMYLYRLIMNAIGTRSPVF